MTPCRSGRAIKDSEEHTIQKDPLLSRITIDPKVLVGEPILRELRICVEQILKALAAGVPRGDLLKDYPEFEPEGIQEAPTYTAELVLEEHGIKKKFGSGMTTDAYSHTRTQ